MVVVGRGDVLAIVNPYKERNTWNEKWEDTEQKLYTLQNNLIELQEKVGHMDPLQEEVKTNNPSSSMVARVIEMKAFLKAEEKFYEYASYVVADKTRQTRKD